MFGVEREREDRGASVLWTMVMQIETERERRKYTLLWVYVSLLSQLVGPTVHQLWVLLAYEWEKAYTRNKVYFLAGERWISFLVTYQGLFGIGLFCWNWKLFAKGTIDKGES